MTCERIVIISDTHLGRPKHAARSAEALRSLWCDAGHLIVNGDVAEVHHPNHRAAAARETMHLLELGERDNVQITLLSGNHDPFLSDHRCLELHGGEVFVTHGDALHPAIAPWSPSAARMRLIQREAFESLSKDGRGELTARLTAAQHAAHAEWDVLREEAMRSTITGMLLRPAAWIRVLHYWWTFPSLAARFAASCRIPARFIVTGHTHHPGCWHTHGRIVMNTGSFGFPGRPRAVVIDHDAIAFMPIRDEGSSYRLAREPVARFQLDAVGCESQGPGDPPRSAANTLPVKGRRSAA